MNIEAFTGRAEAYATARPGYSDEVVEYIRTLVPPDAVFADIGAGTGIFTAQIAKCGYKVFAVEPNADMRGQLAKTLATFPNARIVNGTAEATTLPDHCADVITNAQALRRFDLGLFRDECIRIGKPGPTVITLFNDEGDYASPHYEKALGCFYGNPAVRKFSDPTFFTRGNWLLHYLSMEGVPMENEAEYDEWNAELDERFDRENVDGLLRLNLTTYVYSERIK